MKKGFLLLILLLIWHNASAQTKIAFMAPFTGEESSLTKEAFQFAQVTLDLFNERTGLSIALIEFDTEGNTNKALEIAQQISEDKRIVAVIGPMVNHICAATRPIFSNAGLASISPRCSQTGLTDKAWPNFFSVIPSDKQQADLLINYWLYAPFDWVFALLIEDQTSYASNLNFEIDALMKATMNFSNRVAVAANQLKYTDIARDIIEADVRLAFFSTTSSLQRAEMVRQLDEQGYEGILFFPDVGFDQGWLADTGKAAEGVYVSSFYPQPSQQESFKTYLDRFERLHGNTYGWAGMTSLLATFGTLTALENCQASAVHRICVSDALNQLNLKETPLGIPLSFKEGQRVLNEYFIYQVQEGNYIQVFPAD